MCLDTQSHTPAIGEATRDCTIKLVTRVPLSSPSVLALGYHFYDKMSMRNMKLKLSVCRKNINVKTRNKG